MRKIIFVLTLLLLVSPVLARFEITCTSDSSGEVTVRYDRSLTGDANLPRAFGLDITLNNDANIVSISDLNPSFWVHPGSIDVNTDGDDPVVDSNGTAILSDVNYPQAGGLVGPPDSNGMTIEMGSLYLMADGNQAPASSGVLFKFIVDADCNVAIAGNTALGKVVLENAKEDNTDYGSGCTVSLGCACYGDIDEDGDVQYKDLGDLAQLLNNYGTIISRKRTILSSDTAHYNECGDADNDGDVQYKDLGDIAQWLNNYGTIISRKRTILCPHAYGP